MSKAELVQTEWEKGYAAGMAGKPAESNPWPIGRANGFQWRSGWYHGKNRLPRPEIIEAKESSK